MEIQFLGLLCLLVGIGSVFFVWSLALKEQSATTDQPVERTEPQIQPVVRKQFTAHSLTPVARIVTTHSETTNANTGAASRISSVREADVFLGEAPALDHDDADSLAATHLEIANQFFQMGDFEGAADMCNLVLENQSASSIQRETASNLQAQC